MSRRGNCYDNAPIESFWGMLKIELVHHRRYATRHEAMQEITEYINLSKIVRYRGTREPVFQPSQSPGGRNMASKADKVKNTSSSHGIR